MTKTFDLRRACTEELLQRIRAVDGAQFVHGFRYSITVSIGSKWEWAEVEPNVDAEIFAHEQESQEVSRG